MQKALRCTKQVQRFFSEPHLAIVLFNIEHVQGSHLPCKNIGKCSTALGNSDVEKAAGKSGNRVTPRDINLGSENQTGGRGIRLPASDLLCVTKTGTWVFSYQGNLKHLN